MDKKDQKDLCANGSHKFIHVGGDRHECEGCGKKIRVRIVR